MLRVLLAVIFLISSSPSAMAELEWQKRLEFLSGRLKSNPFHKETLSAYRDIVEENKDFLSQSELGKKYLHDAEKWKAVQAFKQKIDVCLGEDALEFDASRRIVNAAALWDCLNHHNGIQQMQEFTKRLEGSVHRNKTESYNLVRKGVRDQLLQNTLSQINQVEAVLDSHFYVKMNRPGLWDAVCDGSPQCPQGFPQKLKADYSNIRNEFAKLGIERKTPEQITARVREGNRKVRAVFMKSQPYNETLTLNHQMYNPKHPRNEAMKRVIEAELEDLYSSTKLEEVQKELAADPHLQFLGQSPEFKPYLAMLGKPEITHGEQQSRVQLRVPGAERPFNRLGADRKFGLRGSGVESYLKDRYEAFRGPIVEMARDVYQQKRDQPEDVKDDLKKLIYGNPKGFADLVFQNPEQNFPALCEALKQAKEDQDDNEMWSYVALGVGLVGFALGFGLVGGVTSFLVTQLGSKGAATLVASLAVTDIGLSAKDYMFSQNIIDQQEIACALVEEDFNECDQISQAEFFQYVNMGASVIGVADFAAAAKLWKLGVPRKVRFRGPQDRRQPVDPEWAAHLRDAIEEAPSFAQALGRLDKSSQEALLDDLAHLSPQQQRDFIDRSLEAEKLDGIPVTVLDAYKPATVEQNRAFLAAAETNDRNIAYMNATELKDINDIHFKGDKTKANRAMAYRHLLVKQELQKLIESDPKYFGAEVDIYWDYKTLAYAFSDKIPAEQVEQLIDAAGKKWYAEMKEAGWLDEVSDEADPSRWFDRSVVRSSDEENTAQMAEIYARANKNFTEGGGLSKETDLKANLEMQRMDFKDQMNHVVHDLHTQLSGKPEMPGVLTRYGDRYELSESAWAELRKASDVDDLIQRFQANLDVDIDRQVAERAMYAREDLDTFLTTAKTPYRRQASLDEAVYGGFNIDFANAGAANFAEAARFVRDADNLREAAQGGQRGADIVTNRLNKARKRVEKIVKRFEKEFKNMKFNVRCSGDDCVAIPTTRSLSDAEKKQIFDALHADTEMGFGVRIGSIDPGVPAGSQRSVRGAHGEETEKQLRKALGSDTGLSAARIRELGFSINNHGRDAGRGVLQLVVSPRRGASPLTRREAAIIQRQFARAVDTLNGSVNAQYTPSF